MYQSKAAVRFTNATIRSRIVNPRCSTLQTQLRGVASQTHEKDSKPSDTSKPPPAFRHRNPDFEPKNAPGALPKGPFGLKPLVRRHPQEERMTVEQAIRYSKIAGVILVALLIYDVFEASLAHAEAPPLAADQVEIIFEKPKKRKGSMTKEDNRDLISSQHLQVKKSWENPGVYAWGSNTGKVAAPDSDEAYIKIPRRIPFFDDKLLRDLKLDRMFGAAVTESGDLLQWGKDFCEEETQPTVTLKGKNLKQIEISRDRILALSENGAVYSLPVSQYEQREGPKPMESSWVPFWNASSPISYRPLKPTDLAWNEKVISISGGLEHLLLLTNKGRVFSAASGSEDFPSRGQLGIPGLTWHNRPEGRYDMCHEIGTLKGFNIGKIAAGDFHSLALDKDGRCFSFGDNTSGQAAFEWNAATPIIDCPSLVPLQQLYLGTNNVPKVTNISAGGLNSFFEIEATRVLAPDEDPATVRGIGRISADVWAAGHGVKGSLGTGKWVHSQGVPAKITPLSGMFEYDEAKNAMIPIRVAQMSIGANHCAAVMKNVTYLGASDKSSENDTNWGADALLWGGNEYYQIGNGKRNNTPSPVYIQPLDRVAEREAGRKDMHRLHITPRHTVKAKGRKVSMEQKFECGRNVTAVYSAV
ncbi:MAG: hypothetical protein Q9227_008066 [Pyrenula ochraceoflavens]